MKTLFNPVLNLEQAAEIIAMLNGIDANAYCNKYAVDNAYSSIFDGPYNQIVSSNVAPWENGEDKVVLMETDLGEIGLDQFDIEYTLYVNSDANLEEIKRCCSVYKELLN